MVLVGAHEVISCLIGAHVGHHGELHEMGREGAGREGRGGGRGCWQAERRGEQGGGRVGGAGGGGVGRQKGGGDMIGMSFAAAETGAS
jgi:hypothetical protein